MSKQSLILLFAISACSTPRDEVIKNVFSGDGGGQLDGGGHGGDGGRLLAMDAAGPSNEAPDSGVVSTGGTGGNRGGAGNPGTVGGMAGATSAGQGGSSTVHVDGGVADAKGSSEGGSDARVLHDAMSPVPDARVGLQVCNRQRIEAQRCGEMNAFVCRVVPFSPDEPGDLFIYNCKTSGGAECLKCCPVQADGSQWCPLNVVSQ